MYVAQYYKQDTYSVIIFVKGTVAQNVFLSEQVLEWVLNLTGKKKYWTKQMLTYDLAVKKTQKKQR
jgi:hypothetical protein